MSENLSSNQIQSNESLNAEAQVPAAAKELHCNPVSSFTELIAAYQLVYQQYLMRGYCSASIHKLYFNQHSLLENSVTLAATLETRTLGTLTLVHDSGQLLPSDSVFSTELSDLRSAGLSLLEVSMFAVSEDSFRIAGSDIQLLLMAEALVWSLESEVDLAVVTINPRHEGFYKICFGAKVIGKEKTCGQVRGNPGLLIALDVAGIRSGKRKIPSCLNRVMAQVGHKDKVFTLSSEHVRELIKVAPRDWNTQEEHLFLHRGVL